MTPRSGWAALLLSLGCLAIAGCATVTPPAWPSESTHYLYGAASPTQMLWPQHSEEPSSVAGMRDWLSALGSTYTLGHTYAPNQLTVRLGSLTERGNKLAGASLRGEGRLLGVMAWDADLASTAYLFPGASHVQPASPTDFAIGYGNGPGALRWRLWRIVAPTSVGGSIRGPVAVWSDTQPWVAVVGDGTRMVVVDEALRVERESGEPLALPGVLADAAVASVMPMLDATHVAVMVRDPQDPRGPRAYVWRPGDDRAFRIDGVLGGRVAGPRLDLLMASPNTIYRLSRDADHRPQARKVLAIPSYPRPASISPDETRMVSYRQQAYGKSYMYAVHQISDDGTRVSSTDGDQDVLGSYVVWLPHGLGAPSGVVVVPPPSGWDAASP